jgi:hypothetical protein
VNWAGAPLLDLTNWSFTNWLNPQFIVTAPGTNTTLQFGFRDDPAYLGLDEVTVQPFPAPIFISEKESAGSIVFTYTSMPGFQYQVQYSLDLKTWANLGPSEYASGYTSTGSDQIGPDPHRFYRVAVLEPLFIF